MRQAFADTMYEVGIQDEKLVVLVGDISHNILKPFAANCPGRYYNVGIMEPTIVGMAAGLSMSGLHPVVHTIAPFLIDRSYEQLKLDFGYQKVGGVMVSVGAGFDYAGLGCSHHSYTDCGLVKSIPGSVVICPSSRTEFKTLFRQNYKEKHLTYFRLSEKHGCEFPQAKTGKGEKVKDGDRITIVAVGPQLRTVLDADIPGAEIIYIHTVKPLDMEMILASSNKTGRIVVIEEHSDIGGVAQEIGAYGISIPNEFQRGYGSRQQHLDAMGFTPEGVKRACL